MFKIALSAGHGLYSAGKRCLKSIDPNETREWSLNSRICDKVQTILSEYDGAELIRVDDITGKVNVSLKKRTDTANKWGAHLYLSIHHNAGINGGSGGGIVAYTYTSTDTVTADWKVDFYNALIRKTGLRGNRANPLATADFHELRETDMPAVLLELGFMDSVADVPIILSEKYANQCAEAISEVLISRCGLKKKSYKPQSVALPDVIYQVYTAERGWLPNVNGESDYAGLPRQDIQCIYAELTEGDIEYQVHTLGGRWLPWVKNREDYAGIIGKDIDCVRVRLLGDPSYSVQCRVSRVGGSYYPWVTDNNDYAGVYGKKIDRLQIRIIKKA